jgi:NAD(P) transhydrogenase subunit alpha
VIIGVPKESYPGERRVALVPALIPGLVKAKLGVMVERGAGLGAGITDEEFQQKGAELTDRDTLFAKARIITQVRAYGTNAAAESDLAKLGPDHITIGFADPLSAPESALKFATTKSTLIAMELIPRITRAQSMDALSSMATIAGYKAVVLAAGMLPKIFPMLMTAAGTVSPAKVFVIGAGVAGLQACATAKRLGAVVSAYDVRAAVKEQVQSVGAKFVELEVAAGEAEDKGGYAKALGEDFYKKQRELMSKVVAASDVVITTAAVPGKKSPVLVTGDMVKLMAPGSVIVDLAAERGGNCELTRADEEIVAHGVTILGPTNLPSSVPNHASQMYAKNVVTLLNHLVKNGELTFDFSDEITQGIVVTHNGEIANPRIRELLSPPADQKPAASA